MAVEQIAERHARERVRLAKRTARRLVALWRRVDRQAITDSWRALLPAALVELSTAQATAAAAADPYLDAVAGGSPARVNAMSLAGIASDGRPLASLLYLPAITALEQIGAGNSPSRALATGAFELDLITRTQVADAGRVADQVAITGHRQVSGYRRMLVGATCSRCIVLAGRWYRWSSGFQRHPRLPLRLHTHPCRRGRRRAPHEPAHGLRLADPCRAGQGLHAGGRRGDPAGC